MYVSQSAKWYLSKWYLSTSTSFFTLYGSALMLYRVHHAAAQLQTTVSSSVWAGRLVASSPRRRLVTYDRKCPAPFPSTFSKLYCNCADHIDRSLCCRFCNLMDGPSRHHSTTPSLHACVTISVLCVDHKAYSVVGGRPDVLHLLLIYPCLRHCYRILPW